MTQKQYSYKHCANLPVQYLPNPYHSYYKCVLCPQQSNNLYIADIKHFLLFCINIKEVIKNYCVKKLYLSKFLKSEEFVHHTQSHSVEKYILFGANENILQYH